MVFSPNGMWVASSSWDGTAILHNLLDGVTHRTVRLEGVMPAFNWIPHGVASNQLAWDEQSEFVAVALSRVRKFQGQTHPQRIPGAVALLATKHAGFAATAESLQASLNSLPSSYMKDSNGDEGETPITSRAAFSETSSYSELAEETDSLVAVRLQNDPPPRRERY